MAQRLNIDELLKEAQSVWRMEGMDSSDSDTPLYNIHEDPVSRLLLGALNYQSNMLSDDISSFREDLADECVDLAAPIYLSSPCPAIAMLQAFKAHSKGSKNNEKTTLDGDVSFTFTKEVGTKRLTIPFMPLFSTTVMDLSIRSVEKVGRNRWRLEIEDMEGSSSISGLSIYLPNIDTLPIEDRPIDYANMTEERIGVFAGDIELPVSNISDFESLPFSLPFLKGMAFSKNSLQCNVLQSIQDSFCCLANSYCIVGDMDDNVRIPRRDGCMLIDIELPFLKSNAELSVSDVLLNCVPIVNVELHSTTLSQNNPVKSIETGDNFFLSTLPPENANNNDSFVVRKVATNRFSPALWTSKMIQLLDQYNSQYNVMEHLVDDKVRQSFHPFVMALKQSLAKYPKTDEGLYLILKNKMISSVDAQWFSTSGSFANDIIERSKFQCSSAEIDSERSQLVSKTAFGRNPITDPIVRQHAMRYYQVSRDRIVSKADIVSFCQFKLYSMFSVSTDDIKEIRINNTVRNSYEGFYIRSLTVNINVRSGCVDPYRASISLERMIRYRTASTTPIRVIINE